MIAPGPELRGGTVHPVTRVALNGFGRIGRALVRAYCARRPPEVDLVAINDTADPETLAHLFRYDTVHGPTRGQVRSGLGTLMVGSQTFEIFRQSDPAGLPWRRLHIDVVIDATGRHRSRALADRHRRAGANRVVVSAPVPDADLTAVYGINHTAFDPGRHRVISNASCTTHGLAPLLSVLDEAFGWQRGYFTTIHPATGDQAVVDQPHVDPRRGRGALGAGIIPTSSSAVTAVREVLPDIGVTLDGMAYRVPTLTPAVIDLVAQVDRRVTVADVTAALCDAADRFPPGVLALEDQPLVAADYVGNPHSTTVDTTLLAVTDDHQVHVTAWYDNETAYAHRLLDLMVYLATRSSDRPMLGADQLIGLA